MLQFSYTLSRDDGNEKFNQVINDIQALFLPDCYVRYLEAYGMREGFIQRRFDILDKGILYASGFSRMAM